MIQAILAGVIGAIFIAVTSVFPGINLLNLVFGFWFFIAGMVAAFAWSKLSGGRASVAYGTLAGVLAGGIFSVGSFGLSAAYLSTTLDGFGKQLASVEAVQKLPDTMTAEQWLDMAEAMAKRQTDEARREINLAKIKKNRTDLAKWRENPENNRRVEYLENFLSDKIAGLKKGDLGWVMYYVIRVFLVIGLLITAVATGGGLLGGLMFGDNPAPEAPPAG